MTPEPVDVDENDPSTWVQKPERITNPWMALTKLHHLVPRFIGSLPKTPPSVDDEVWVDRHLLAGERALWIKLSNQDRRHCVALARRTHQSAHLQKQEC